MISRPDDRRVRESGKRSSATSRVKQPISSLHLVFTLQRDKEQLSAIRDALLPEIKAGKRTKMSIDLVNHGQMLVLTIGSPDLVSMRASMNSNLRLVASAMKTIESVS